jgi:hypothetical protein
MGVASEDSQGISYKVSQERLKSAWMSCLERARDVQGCNFGVYEYRPWPNRQRLVEKQSRQFVFDVWCPSDFFFSSSFPFFSLSFFFFSFFLIASGSQIAL